MAKSKKSGRAPSRDEDAYTVTFILRMPLALRNRVAAIAEATHRSMNGTILECIGMHLDRVEAEMTIDQVWAKVEALEGEVSSLRERVRRLEGRGE